MGDRFDAGDFRLERVGAGWSLGIRTGSAVPIELGISLNCLLDLAALGRAAREAWDAAERPELEARQEALVEAMDAAGWVLYGAGGGTGEYVPPGWEEMGDDFPMVSVPHDPRRGWRDRMAQAEREWADVQRQCPDPRCRRWHVWVEKAR